MISVAISIPGSDLHFGQRLGSFPLTNPSGDYLVAHRRRSCEQDGHVVSALCTLLPLRRVVAASTKAWTKQRRFLRDDQPSTIDAKQNLLLFKNSPLLLSYGLNKPLSLGHCASFSTSKRSTAKIYSAALFLCPVPNEWAATFVKNPSRMAILQSRATVA